MFDRVMRLPPQVDHLVVQIGSCLPPLRTHPLSPPLTLCIGVATGIPIAYPRMVFLETALESKLNPLVALGRAGSMGLSGFVNKFNADAELLDDLVRARCPPLLFFSRARVDDKLRLE